jgi:Kef-type K+ transport system membrane component KefB
MMDQNNTLSLLGLVIVLMMCLAASWFTGFIGVHTIFGAFVAGIFTAFTLLIFFSLN